MDKSKEILEYLKLEYQKSVEAYIDIYNSIWKIFSYLSALIAGLFVASTKMIPPFTAYTFLFLGTSIIAFWYLGIYCPMNQYGEKRRKMLDDISKEIHNILAYSHTPSLCFANFKPIEDKPFFKALKDAKWHFWAPHKYFRVKFAADTLGTISVLAFIILLFCFVCKIFPFCADP